MRLPLLASLLALLCNTTPAQGTEWVTNGSFTGAMTPWVLGGAFSANPGLEVGWDTTGMGASDSFGVNAGGAVFPGPYPPNTIEQTITVVQGLTYEFRADASGARPAAPGVGNADIGTIWAEVDNVEVARFAFGDYTPQETKRAQIVGRFAPATTGQVTLKIFFQRQYLGGAANPRMNLDNVSIRDVGGPTYWIEGNRELGGTVTHELRGAPGALFGTFIAAGEFPGGTTLPGVNGLWFLDLTTTATLAIGLLDANGAASLTSTIPTDPLFLTFPLWYQAGTLTTSIDLGFHFGVVCTQ